MSFVITSERPSGPHTYEKVGRLIASDDGMIHLFRDGAGEIGVIARTDILCALQGLSVPELSISDSGRGIIWKGPDLQEYHFLAGQVREMIRSWPQKKAALFQMREREG